MHSKIFQVGLKPMNVDDYVHPYYFYDNSEDFADYIGDEVYDEERKECIKSLAREFSSIFTLDEDGETLVFKGIGTFLTDWNNAIKDAASKLEDGVYDRTLLHKICTIKECTHLDCDFRFFIEDWEECAGPAQDFIEFAINELKPGDKLYVGAVIDFHY